MSKRELIPVTLLEWYCPTCDHFKMVGVAENGRVACLRCGTVLATILVKDPNQVALPLD
jgi:ribosomal protein S27E